MISTSADCASAQRLTQTVLGDVDNAFLIERWIARQEANYNPNSKPSCELRFPNEVTGRSTSRADYDAHGLQAPARDVYGVKVALKYVQGMDPPFVVLNSMPEA
ncbi:RNase A-like domain-containing protein [Streptomyces sp. NBC_00690]|uniref:RNase A-like domain-containing protein n=1 Tax=Streptomyces sp. NBC_00690 TaxID=2975808 RepID=UPI002E2B36EF|nr:RNase A-like domain-containing protein [Streptomyces sp. NBC_00690]